MPTTEKRQAIQERVWDILKDLQSEHQLKELCGELNYDYRSTQLSSRHWRSANARMLIEGRHVEEPVLLASAGARSDFHVIYTHLRADDLFLGHERLVVSQLLQDHPYSLFVFSNAEKKRWHFLNVKYHEKFGRHSRIFRRITVGPEERLRTASERLTMLDIEEIRNTKVDISPLSIQQRHDEAFDVEAVTAAFFSGNTRTGEQGYKQIFDDLQNDLFKQTKDRLWAHDYALQFLNRLMFLYFVQRKRWLGDEGEFLHSFWKKYNTTGQPKDSFLDGWLKLLFFEAFNNKFNPGRRDRSHFPSEILQALTHAPFLNGGLFKPNRLDDQEQRRFNITDSRFETVFSFLQRYNFTIAEDSPLNQEVAVDPEMIGKVYETLVNVSVETDERGDASIFYTPRTEIDLMCRLAVVDNLANHLGSKHKNLLYEVIFALEQEEKNSADNRLTEAKLWSNVDACLRELTVVDPACGSGSFLVGMLHILNDLLARANRQFNREETNFERKKRIIGQSLYGVDVMEWAAHVAELRLWLALIVDTNYTRAEMQVRREPLLPHFTFKIRHGDSLVQEFGSINLSHMRAAHDIPSELKARLAKLKNEKLKFYNNEPGCQFISAEQALQEELHLFRDILDARHYGIQEEIKKLRRRIEGPQGRQMRLDGTVEEQSYQMQLETIEWQRQVEALTDDSERIREARATLKTAKDIPFAWDISFVEIFTGEKRGFDIVIGNPPYVRQEIIADPRLPRDEITKENKQAYKAKLARSVYQAFPTFFGYKTLTDLASNKIDAKSDLYVYFYFHALSLLNPHGSFCFITSNSWLDVGYGAKLQEFLLKHCHVRMVIDNQVQRSFGQADVNTVIVLFSAPIESHEVGLDQTARFVMFKQPFEHALSPSIFPEIEAIRERRTTPTYKIHPVEQKMLLTAGCETPSTDDNANGNEKVQGPLIKIGRYLGDKWGGKYLRAPDIYWTVLKKGKGKLLRLKDIAEVRRGFTTGANEFFYLDKERIREWIIEKEFLSPSPKNVREIKSLVLNTSDFTLRLFMCSQNRTKLSGTSASKYIKWGESRGFNRRPTCSTRVNWWDLGKREPTPIFCNYQISESIRFYFPNRPAYVSDNFFEIHGIDNSLHCVVSLNSTLTQLCVNLLGRANFGGGLLKIQTYELDEVLLLSPSLLDLNEKQARVLLDFGNNALTKLDSPERRAIDSTIFEVLKLTKDEIDAVYEAVIDLVKARLKKAESLNPNSRSEQMDEEMETTAA